LIGKPLGSAFAVSVSGCNKPIALCARTANIRPDNGTPAAGWHPRVVKGIAVFLSSVPLSGASAPHGPTIFVSLQKMRTIEGNRGAGGETNKAKASSLAW